MNLYNEPEPVVEFRAGKMTMEGTMVYADVRKGLIRVYRFPDGIINFVWKDRNTNAYEDEFILFPKQAEWKRVPQCATARVFLLKLNEPNQKHFYWMQEPNDGDDEIIFTIMNIVLKYPPTTPNRPNSADTDSLEEMM